MCWEVKGEHKIVNSVERESKEEKLCQTEREIGLFVLWVFNGV